MDRANQLLSEYEGKNETGGYQPNLFVMDEVQPEKNELVSHLQDLDIDSMSPREALDCLYELKKIAKTIE